MDVPSVIAKRWISSSVFLHASIKRTEDEIVQIFDLPHEKAMEDIALSRNTQAYNTLVDRFIRILKIFKWGPDAERALEVLNLKVDQRFIRHVLKTDVDIHTKVRFFNWSTKRKSFTHDSVAYLALIHCLNKAGFYGEMWRTIQKMARSPCIISSSDLSDIVRVLGRAKMGDKALTIFYHMKSRKCKPTSSTYNSVISMLMQEGYHGKVHELYNDMCKEGSYLPNTFTYSALISVFTKLGQHNSAISLCHEMKENGLLPTANIYTTLLSVYFKLGKVEEALCLIKEMRTSGCIPTVFTYTEVVKGLGHNGRVDDAYNLFLDLLKEGCKLDVVFLNNLINLLCRVGRMEDAIKTFNKIGSMGLLPNVVTYNCLIKGLFRLNAPIPEVDRWVQRMKESGVSLSSYTYSILIDGFCNKNNVECALGLLEEMEEKEFLPCPSAYCSLINALGRAKQYDAANDLFLELKQQSAGCPSSRAYAVMIKHYGKCGRLRDAMDLFAEMKRLGRDPDVYAYNALMSGLVRAGLVSEAHSLLRVMGESGCAPDTSSHNILLSGFSRMGNGERVLEVLEKMKRSGIKPDTVSYNTILSGLSRAGRFEEAARLIKEMDSKGLKCDRITSSSLLEALGNVDEE